MAAFCEALHVDPGHLRPLNGHRGRGVEKLTKNLTFEKMAARGSPASSSTQGLRGSSSVGRVTKQSRCGTCQTANASRLSPDIGEPPLRSVACAPRSPGERRSRSCRLYVSYSINTVAARTTRIAPANLTYGAILRRPTLPALCKDTGTHCVCMYRCGRLRLLSTPPPLTGGEA